MKFYISSFLIFSVLGVSALGVFALKGVSYAQVPGIEQKISEVQAKIVLLQRDLQQALQELEGLLAVEQAEKTKYLPKNRNR
jgi:hypothetical protein